MFSSFFKRILPHNLFFIHDGSSWVLSEETKAISSIASGLGYRVGGVGDIGVLEQKNVSVYFNCQFQGVRYLHKKGKSKVAIAYFHGLPGTEQIFTDSYRHLCNQGDLVDRLHVSHSEMRECLLEGGIAPEKIFQIPIGVDSNLFSQVTNDLRSVRRKELNIDEKFFVVGSFQKDGNGWGEGLEPKWVKGPDIFLRVMENLKDKIPHLHVLLSGPSRGFVKKGLESIGINFTHVYYDDYAKVCKLYEALDCYLVASRQEGGPKAILESMASKVPLVTTRVGQAMDLVEDEVNGFMTGSEDIDGLTDRVFHLYQNRDQNALVGRGFKTASLNTYKAQIPMWREFFNGFVS